MGFIDDYIEQALSDKRRGDALGAAKEAAQSGGITGAIMGAGNSFLHGERSIPKILLKGGLLGLGAAGLTGGGTFIGSELLGAPEPGADDGGFTRRAGVGGAIAGGALGLGAGALIGSGKLKWLSKLPGAARAAEVAKKELPLDNLATDYLKKWASTPGSGAAKKSAALLGTVGAGVGAGMSAGEGMQVDYLSSKEQGQEDDEREQRRQRLKAYLGDLSGLA